MQPARQRGGVLSSSIRVRQRSSRRMHQIVAGNTAALRHACRLPPIFRTSSVRLNRVFLYYFLIEFEEYRGMKKENKNERTEEIKQSRLTHRLATIGSSILLTTLAIAGNPEKTEAQILSSGKMQPAQTACPNIPLQGRQIQTVAIEQMSQQVSRKQVLRTSKQCSSNKRTSFNGEAHSMVTIFGGVGFLWASVGLLSLLGSQARTSLAPCAAVLAAQARRRANS